MNKKNLLGSILVENNLISVKLLNTVLKLQQKQGSKLGEILIAYNKINYKQLYRAIAIQLNTEFIDLIKSPCDTRLLRYEERELYIKYEFLPWRKQDNEVSIVTTNPNKFVDNWAKKTYGENYRIYITSPVDIYLTVQKVFGDVDEEEVRNSLYRTSANYSAKTLFSFKQKLFLLLSIITLISFLYIYIQVLLHYFF
jgi:hypothetical protein